mmetsp:Transcript_19983/g.30254  ORF Transcript_19983/g.30254 Transcript_19983/m.30254 type:complete len:627 (-) Transcript_19983:341-2221(-)|eukprot:CAMPEP_0194084932 /NCGR_PEP_ID=MMETSP0149-20130528/15456_1 /TAXON_ID=122233 /ORGANISM="Chaetoceros debilis, Strain MM31A-1" /LENGTH=626 /DNA_ID=CAMNT_0038767703 /DNA_START=108 /DNA_END=1988 /DNA_ORIENTATION=+
MTVNADQADFQNKLDSLLSLITSRSEGLAADDEVETAVSALLPTAPADLNASQKIQPLHTGLKNIGTDIVVDEDNYDDDDDDDDDNKTEQTKPPGNGNGSKTASRSKATLESLQEQEKELERRENEDNPLSFTISDTWKKLEDIPLGTKGAKIMITFGDGPQPIPNACATVLLATRQCLQNAVKDARGLRRKMRIDYQKAKVTVNLHRAKKSERAILGENVEGYKDVDLNLYFSAIRGNDKLCYENPCGFDIAQLEKLFPEEMYAYQRWNKMHQAYTDSKDEKKEGEEADAEEKNIHENDDEHEDMKKTAEIMNENVGGHLRDRLAQFDVRTEKMKENWYMAFSEVRKGSFLDRGGKTSEDKVWDEERKKGKPGNGRRKASTWEALPASHIQFLHWVGFDQRSALPPPDTVTTEALAFLGYDFMGKIIEKSIFLKFLEKREDQRSNSAGADNEGEPVLEMGHNNQLTKEDIDKSLADSTIVAHPLYNAAESVVGSSAAAQIYFGPGFEDRIEFEMEEMIMGKSKDNQMSEEELANRKKEDTLFEELKSPPVLLDGIMDVLGDQEKTDAVAEKRLGDKKRRRNRETQKMIFWKSAYEGKEIKAIKKRKYTSSKKKEDSTEKSTNHSK